MKRVYLLALIVQATGCIDDPVTNTIPGEYEQEYQLIWNLFDGNYVGFAVSGFNWNAVYDTYLQQSRQVQSREEMTELTLSLLAGLQDRHVCLVDPGGNTMPSWQPDLFINCSEEVLMNYLEPWGFQWTQEDVWGYCQAGTDSVPYFVLKSLHPELNLSLFDNILLPLIDEPVLIFDARLCSEGADGTASNLVRRFADIERTVHMTRHRVSGSSWELAEPQPVYVIPRGWHYQGQVILLTGEGNTGSSEVFICDMAEFPHVTTVGDTTGGSGNWQTEAWLLPDGWHIVCPVVTLARADSSLVEGTGVFPDHLVEATEADFQSGYDPVLEYALDIAKAPR